MSYQDTIREIMTALGHGGVDARHVEAYMRLEHSTLDGLSREHFAVEVEVGVRCVREGGVAMAETLAESYGL
jgi:hypothetical protein